jgi:hypothetical protein
MHRHKWMRLWEEIGGGEARTRFLGDTDKLRGLLRYLVLRRDCGFKNKSLIGPEIYFKGDQ